MGIPVRFAASAVSLSLGPEARVRFGFVPAPAQTYGLDPAFGDLDLYIAAVGRLAVPLAVPRAVGPRPPSGPTVVDGELLGVPVSVTAPDGTTRHLSQAVVLATGFGVPGPVPRMVHLDAVMGPPALPRTHLLRFDGSAAPILLCATDRPPRPGTAVAVRARLSSYEVIAGEGAFSLCCLQGTARALAELRGTAGGPAVPTDLVEADEPDEPDVLAEPDEVGEPDATPPGAAADTAIRLAGLAGPVPYEPGDKEAAEDEEQDGTDGADEDEPGEPGGPDEPGEPGGPDEPGEPGGPDEPGEPDGTDESGDTDESPVPPEPTPPEPAEPGWGELASQDGEVAPSLDDEVPMGHRTGAR